MKNEATTQNLRNRLNRAEGQIRGIKNMLEKEATCDQMLTQISAVQSALDSVSRIILDSHMETCIIPRLQNNDPTIKDEFLKTVERLLYKGRKLS